MLIYNVLHNIKLVLRANYCNNPITGIETNIYRGISHFDKL